MFKKLKEFLYLGRLNNPTGALLLAYPCFWGVALAKPDPNILFYYTIAFFIGSFSMRAAGCTWNDIQDRDLDKLVMRTKNRPIASGKITIMEGIVFIIFNSLIGIVVLIMLPLKAIIIAIISIPLAAIYPFTKRISYFPQIWLGITFNIGLLIGYSTITKNYPPIEIFLMYVGAIFWTLGYDTMYAIQDYKDDIKHNIKSSAVKMKEYSGIFASICYVFSSIIFFIAISMNQSGFIPLTFIVLTGIWQAYSSLTTGISDTTKALKNFQISSISGLVIWLAIVLDLFIK